MFLPPANIDDFSKSNDKEAILKQAWHDKMNAIVTGITAEKDEQGNPSYPRFYNPLDVSDNEDVTTAAISWSGYPLVIENWLNLSSSSSMAEHDRGFRSAELLRKITYRYRIYKRNGNEVLKRFELTNYNPAQGLALFPVENGRVQTQNAFSLKERIQDEYLEWHSKKDKTGRVTEISFTAEGPGYWETIAKHDAELLTRLYKEYISDDVVENDLYWQNDIACPIVETDLSSNRDTVTGYTLVYKKGDYNQYNKWNTSLGVMHLIQRNNTLGAEIRLAADATKRYGIKPDLNHNPTRFELVACGVPAGINRNSDPTISDEVNKLALSNFKVSISNPIGLYIGEIQISGIRDSNGNSVNKNDILVIERGDLEPFSPKILRFKLVIPQGTDDGLEKYTLNGFNLKYGGPVAKETSIIIYGEAIESQVSNPVIPCDSKACYHPQKPAYIIPVNTNTDCSSINWSKVSPPFTVADLIQQPSTALAVDHVDSAISDVSRNRVVDE